MRIDLINRPTHALIAANVILTLVIALQLINPVTPSAAREGVLPDTESALPEFGNVALSPPHLTELTDMLERPLFFDDRRMPDPPKEEIAAPPPTPLRLELEGVAISGGSRVAVLRNLSNNLLLQLAEGETHDGWTLDSVDSNSASFSRGAQVSELALDPGDNVRRR